jgi:hypothetical protein
MKKVVNDKIVNANENEMEPQTGNQPNTFIGNACGFVTITTIDMGRATKFNNNSPEPINVEVTGPMFQKPIPIPIPPQIPEPINGEVPSPMSQEPITFQIPANGYFIFPLRDNMRCDINFA